MSKAVYLYSRNQEKAKQYANILRKFSHRLLPDNIQSRETQVFESEGVAYAVLNPVSSVLTEGKSLGLGLIFGDAQDWAKPFGSYPDGAFCLFRADNNHVEIVSDVVGSRTIWYYLNEDVFIASNSQRAMVALLGDFQFNEDVLPWMLANGTTGPGISWDKRFKMLEINSSVALNIQTWTMQEKSEPLNFNVAPISGEEQEKILAETLEETFNQLDFDFTKWVLPLSGGVDSRAILYYLNKLKPDFRKLRAITWGLPGAVKRKGNDAYVAKALADHLGLQHTYYPLQADYKNVEALFERFLVCGEGRVDAISGYTDGFALWKDLYENGVEGIIRGEQTFGGRIVETDADARRAAGVSLCEDFTNLSNSSFQLPPQDLPEHLKRKQEESLITWRDRLIIEFRAPILKAALNDLKLPYVEVATPLISKGIVNRILTMTDDQRLTKSLFKRVIRKMSIPVDFATEVAIENMNDIFQSAAVMRYFKKHIETADNNVLPEVFKQELLKSINGQIQKMSEGQKLSWKSRLKKMLPLGFKKKLNKLKSKPSVPTIKLAFRTYILCRMNALFLEDATYKK